MKRKGWLSALWMRAMGMALGSLIGIALVTAPVWGVEVHGDEGFSQVSGITGQGTRDEPYVITGEFDAGEGEIGLRISNTTAHFIIQDARFTGATEAGLWLEDVRNGWVVRCLFEGNEVGVRTIGTAEVTFTLNTFRDNRTHALDHTYSTRWDDGRVGNWWEGYAGDDENGDGKGSLPWEVAGEPGTPEARLDRFPLVEPLVGITPPEGAVLLQVISAVGERHKVVSEAETSYVMTSMGMRMPAEMTFRMVVEELVTGSHGAGNFYDVRQTVLEDTGSATFMGMPDEYLSDEGAVTQVRMHRFGSIETVAGDLVLETGIPTETIGWPARWLRVGDSWTHMLEMDAEELGVPDGVGIHRTTTTFDRLEERDGRSLAVLVTEGNSDIEGSEWDPFMGRLDYSAHATFSSTAYVDVVTGRAVEEIVVFVMDGDVKAAVQSVGTFAMRMEIWARDLPPDHLAEVAPVVTAVNRERGVVMISVGSDERVQPGERFEVYHVLQLDDGTELEEYRGLIEVQEIVGPDRSVCTIIEERFPIQVSNSIRSPEDRAHEPEHEASAVRLVLQAPQLAAMGPTQAHEAVDRLILVLEQRFDEYGYTDVQVTHAGEDRVQILLPGGQDVEAARTLAERTGILEFRKVLDAAAIADDLFRTDPTQQILHAHDGSEYYLVHGQPLLTGEVLEWAETRVSTDPRQPGAFVALRFNRAGAERFVEVLREMRVGDRLAIMLDGVVYSAPRITESIKEVAQREGWRGVQDSTMITGAFTVDEARTLAVVLRAGALPVEVTVLDTQVED